MAAGGVSAGPTAANKAPTKIGATAKPAAASTTIKSTVGSKPAPGKSVVTSHKAGDHGDLSKLNAELQDLRMNMDTVEKERDFYFGKLRDIEMLLQANEHKKTPLTENILKILYASEEEKVLIDETGNLSITAANGGASTGGGAGTGHD